MMCKIGDIIVVKKYIGDDGQTIDKQHSFVVIDDTPDMVEGISYDLVANVMSSFKNEEHKNRKLSHKENLEVVSDSIISKTKNSRDGYIKKIGWVVAILLGFLVDMLVGINLFLIGSAIVCISTEGISVYENLGEIGINLPFKKYFEKLDNKESE